MRPLKSYLYILLVICFLAFGGNADGQQINKVPALGYLTGTGSSPNAEFIGQLRDLRYLEGKNITVEFRTAQGKIDELPELARKLARSSVKVIFAADFNAAVASKNATQNISVVFQTLGDPVASGLVSNVARPGKNLTGVAGFGPELSGKRLEINKEVVPGISRVAFLTDPSNVASAATLRETELAAKSLGISLQIYRVSSPEELKNAFKSMKTKGVSALMMNHDPTLTARRNYILRLVGRVSSTGHLRGNSMGTKWWTDKLWPKSR